MNDLLIVGTDTAAGKTTLALLWMAAFSGEYEYWKPLETGDSDSAGDPPIGAEGNCSCAAADIPTTGGAAAWLRGAEGVTIPRAETIAAAGRSKPSIAHRDFWRPLFAAGRG